MNIRLKLMLGAAALIAAGTLAASEAKVMTFNTPADWNQKEPVVVASDGVLTVMNKVFLETSQFTVDPTKTYTLSLKVRTENAPVGEKSWVLAGFKAFDKKGRYISHRVSAAIDGTLTQTVEDAPKGATVIKVKDASKFKNRNVVVTGAKEDLSDLPNFNIAGYVKSTAQNGDVWEITLLKPLRKGIKAGTTIREHAEGGYLYTAGSRKVNEVWQQMSGSIKGIDKSGKWSNKAWPVGTVRASVIILVDWDKKGIDTQLKEVSLSIE